MKNTQAWGFLVSRNQYLDYRTIVAPSFMCEASASSILAKAAEGDLTEQGSALYREIHNSKVGNLTLVFRVIEATAEDTGIAGNGVLKDSFGREIYLIEGIVLKEIMPDVVVTQEDIEKTHKQLVECYREFWDCSTPHCAIPLDIENFTLGTETSLSACLKYNKLKEYIVVNKRQLHIEKQLSKAQYNQIVSLADIAGTKQEVWIKKQPSKEQKDLSQNLAIEKSHPKITSDDSSDEGIWIIISRLIEKLFTTG